MSNLDDLLSKWTRRDNDGLLYDALAEADGMDLLERELSRRTDSLERLMLVVAIGHGTSFGLAGIAALRDEALKSGPGRADIRCAALLGLARRLHEGATKDLVRALADRSYYIKDYALVGLAAYGDSSAYSEVLDYLQRRLPKSRASTRGRRTVTLEALACCYLIRHDRADDLARVGGLIHRRLGKLDGDFEEALDWFWPGVRLEPPDPPSKELAASWFWACCGALFDSSDNHRDSMHWVPTGDVEN